MKTNLLGYGFEKRRATAADKVEQAAKLGTWAQDFGQRVQKQKEDEEARKPPQQEKRPVGRPHQHLNLAME